MYFNKERDRINIIGAGLAGSEAALFLLEKGYLINVYEMRPKVKTPVHKTDLFAELVCSNSLGNKNIFSASGLLKEEIKILGSNLIRLAEVSSVEAGQALAVDREEFSRHVTNKILSYPNVNVIREEVREIPENTFTIVATGPLTSENLFKYFQKFLGSKDLYFYDATSPIIKYDSIDLNFAFWANRYNKGDSAYLNCPMSEKEYDFFYEELIKADSIRSHFPDEERYFEGCLPIEELARRGRDTLLYGPLKPRGLKDPKTNKEPYCVVQLRPENKDKTLFNMVGFQTRLPFKEQDKIFRLIPALKNAEFVRYGVMHKNIYFNPSSLIKESLESKKFNNLFFAGQITGTEGYVEAIATGLLAAINLHLKIQGKPHLVLPKTTVLGSLINHIISVSVEKPAPMNVSFGLLPPILKKMDKKRRYEEYVKRSLHDLNKYLSDFKYDYENK
ncbi:Methylenetetrahydrofolate--tRNA-(uracil-5-)-methyltransferase trmFO [Thermodesulfobium narugense DSM 14796]|uniref:Methylenetetrahydrofolate--tRNA-(uracil-5-)-methyltransferase TrmFO n=1 Tax=Thermodesulfobium narugense DSM 14796 TaxID=747365 RepID=M1E4V9_9BACT|nr:methylenetetrahydrofolate--tRNA-(uracil(54)-C(5))-methyltransferase (FADH(2)-oxidizing) TrmFO [Thermodesulfobium narugense]AEE14597.1 Methylenetetrahydrofolate--tRNA-(uracil-5-)-methyltransferase trmFO [Thermodesulfobium narugense DSM 14796]